MSIKITKVYGTDVCRDGGSYSLAFEAGNGQWYEFFVRVKGIESKEYFPPQLFKGGVNSGEAVKTYSWRSAEKFLACVHDDDPRFQELVELVSSGGVIT